MDKSPAQHSDNSQSVLRPEMALWAGAASVLTVTLLIIIKLTAFAASGSASVLASTVDSVVDATISIMTFFAIRLSLKPPDAEHRFGHGLVEGLVALFQAPFIAGAGFFLFIESVSRFNNQAPVEGHILVIGVMGVATLLSFILVAIQKHSLKYAPSLAVEADQAHYSTDIVINFGVILVVLALQYGAPLWIDPVFAICICLYLALTVKRIAGKGVDMLLDRELPGEVREVITQKVLSHPDVMGIHDLRTKQAGMDIFISFDVELDPSLLLYHAHEIVRQVEHSLLGKFPNAEILIHADPYGDTDDTRHRVVGVHDV